MMEWNAHIGQHEEPPKEEGITLLPVRVPPQVDDSALAEATEEDLELEKRIQELTSETITLPEAKTLGDYPDKLTLSPVLIEGIFRMGRKGILTADSKAGKSFFAIEMAVCVASGHPFLGRKCTKAKVCYFNYEIDEVEFMQRIKDVAKALKIPEAEFRDNLKVVHMRGLSIPLKKMKGDLIALLLKEQLYTREPFGLTILDPIYKITAGDENSAKDVGMFCNDLDRIAKETGSAIFYTHHHAKGDQGGKKAMDRGSGSGVFARDPDLMIDLTELEIDGQTKAALLNNFMCEFWKSKLEETGKEWHSRCAPSDLNSSGYLAALYQKIAGVDPSKISIMVLNETQRFETELHSSKAFRMEFVVRSFENQDPQNVTFRHPIHYLDKSGALMMAEIETHAPGVRKKDTGMIKEKKIDVFVEVVDQLILGSRDGFTTYTEIADALEIDAKTVTRRLKSLPERYEVETNRGAGNVAKVRFVTGDLDG